MDDAPTIANLARVRAGFLMRGTTFKAWCREVGISPSYAHEVMADKTNGPKAMALRARILDEAQRAPELASHG